MCRRVSELTQARYGLLAGGVIVVRLNRAMLGWAKYFYPGRVSPAYRVIELHATQGLRQWLCRKHNVRTGKYVRYPNEHPWNAIRLTGLTLRTDSLA